MKTPRLVWILIALTMGGALRAQVVNLTEQEYHERKVAGTLPAQYHVAYSTLPVAPVQPAPPVAHAKGGGQVNGDCNCWKAPDDTYTLAMEPNDDGSSALITLPFQFNLYGTMYSNCYINNNGNVSFEDSYGTYSPEGFPSSDFIMVAPFWGDVMTYGFDADFNQITIGTVKYKITPTAMYVNWDEVGYFNGHNDKLNSFQLIITDGTDPVIGVGNNVSFCYKDMQWTTGDASQGVDGFGGFPSTVGANRGNGVDFIQFTRNDHPGVDYDGPFGNPDGVDWLDYQNFIFTTAVSTLNIPPIVSSTFLCDTVHVCTGELVDFDLTFLTPESDQLITSATADAPTLPSFQMTEINNGTQYTLHPYFIPGIPDVGYHTITFTGTDNGDPALTTTVSIVIQVTFTPAPPPIITGDTIACPDQGVVLTASSGYDDYIWNNGYNGPVVLVGPGSYLVQATAGPCRLASNTIVITGAPAPTTPVIDGVLFNCGGQPALLSTTEQYDSYNWTNGSEDPTITVGTGTYSVTVANQYGCEATSAPVNVNSANTPDAFFVGDPAGEVNMGATVIYTDQSNPNGTNIVSYHWSIDSLGTGGNGPVFSQQFLLPGVYTVTLTVTTSDGCTDTFTFNQIVVPDEIVVPNVFSPNGDGQNDVLEFTGVEFYDNSLKVFNRWGQEVFTSGNYKNTWKGQDMPEGTYFYVLKLNRNGKEYTGHVTLLR